MKLIPLSHGKNAKVDDEDFTWLSGWKWRLQTSQNKNGSHRHSYAVKSEYDPIKRGTGSTTQMGRLILGITDPKIKCYYIDDDGLNNQRSNLRIATQSEVVVGRTRTNKSKTSKYIGVHKFHKNIDVAYKYIYWQASIGLKDHKNRMKHSPMFPFTEDGEIEAAKWYDENAKKMYGNFARLNFPDIKEMNYLVMYEDFKTRS